MVCLLLTNHSICHVQPLVAHGLKIYLYIYFIKLTCNVLSYRCVSPVCVQKKRARQEALQFIPDLFSTASIGQ